MMSPPRRSRSLSPLAIAGGIAGGIGGLALGRGAWSLYNNNKRLNTNESNIEKNLKRAEDQLVTRREEYKYTDIDSNVFLKDIRDISNKVNTIKAYREMVFQIQTSIEGLQTRKWNSFHEDHIGFSEMEYNIFVEKLKSTFDIQNVRRKILLYTTTKILSDTKMCNTKYEDYTTANFKEYNPTTQSNQNDRLLPKIEICFSQRTNSFLRFAEDSKVKSMVDLIQTIFNYSKYKSPGSFISKLMNYNSTTQDKNMRIYTNFIVLIYFLALKISNDDELRHYIVMVINTLLDSSKYYKYVFKETNLDKIFMNILNDCAKKDIPDISKVFEFTQVGFLDQ